MSTFRNCLRQFFYNFEDIKSSTDLRQRDNKDKITEDPYIDDFKECLKKSVVQETDRKSIILLTQCWIDDRMIAIHAEWRNYHNNSNNVFFDKAKKLQERGLSKECAESIYSFLKMGFNITQRIEEIKKLIENCEQVVDTQDNTMENLTPDIQVLNRKSLLLLPHNFIGYILISSLLLMIIFYFLAGQHIGDIITDKISILNNDICNILQCK